MNYIHNLPSILTVLAGVIMIISVNRWSDDHMVAKPAPFWAFMSIIWLLMMVGSLFTFGDF
jgi:hypothetical protein